MAEFVNSIGKIRGRYGNVIGYVRADGKNCCRGAALTHKPGGEDQKRAQVAFGTMKRGMRWVAPAVQLGFPGGNGFPGGFNGFTSVNVPSAVRVEKIDPGKEVSPRSVPLREFRGTIDYGKLLVAAGHLVIPTVTAEVDAAARKVLFTGPICPVEAIDCFLDDEVYGVLIDPRNRRCRVALLGTRDEGVSSDMEIPEDMEPDSLFVYIFARRADGKDAPESVCLRAVF